MNSRNDLTDLLQSWKPACKPGTGFNRGVWSRIEAAESPWSASVADFFAWVALLAHPRIAATATMVALFGGLFLGNLQARSAQKTRYLQSLNPYAQQSHNR